MKFNPMTVIRRWFDNKRFLIAFSVACAVVFWLVIDITENPSRDITFSDVPVVITDQTDDNGNILTTVGEYNDKVSVTVSGPGYVVSSVNKEDIKVSVSSYAEVSKPGTYVLNLTALVEKSGCTVSKISPSYIQVVYDYDTSAEFEVEIDTSAIQPLVSTEYEIFRSYLKNNSDGVELEKLAVSGPSEIMGQIAKVVVTPILKNNDAVTSAQNYDAAFVFYDHSGNVIDSTELMYNRDTFVRVVIYKTADVKLVPSFKNLPDCFKLSETGMPSYELRVYNEVSKRQEAVSVVKVKGPVDAVDEMLANGLKLSEIDFYSVKPGNTSFNVSFQLDEGVMIVDGTEEVTVKLDLGTLTTKTITIQPSAVRFENLSNGLTASWSSKKTIKVVICGQYGVLRNISANNISVSVDCSEITSKTIETKDLKVSVSKDYVAWVNSFDPSQISIVVE